MCTHLPASGSVRCSRRALRDTGHYQCCRTRRILLCMKALHLPLSCQVHDPSVIWIQILVKPSKPDMVFSLQPCQIMEEPQQLERLGKTFRTGADASSQRSCFFPAPVTLKCGGIFLNKCINTFNNLFEYICIFIFIRCIFIRNFQCFPCCCNFSFQPLEPLANIPL